MTTPFVPSNNPNKIIGNVASVQGFDQLFRVMDDLSDEITRAKTDHIWIQAMREAMKPVLDTARVRVPKHDGELLDALYLKAHRPQVRDKKALSYQGESVMARVSIKAPRKDKKTGKLKIEVVEYKTKSGKIKLRNKYNFEDSNKPVALAMEFGTAHTAGRPFLRSSLESNINTVIVTLGNAVWQKLTTGKYASLVKETRQI
jgi:HK97 gp10 family phage protein